eukprot:12938316-Alexandrium_andersonii.AAC.1
MQALLASSHCKAPDVQSTIRPRPVSAAFRLNPQPTKRKMQNRCKRSELELRGPKSGLKTGPRSPRE